jgi:hypothetical protein
MAKSTVINDLNQLLTTTLDIIRAMFEKLRTQAGVLLGTDSRLDLLHSRATSILFDIEREKKTHFWKESIALNPIEKVDIAMIGIITDNAVLDPDTPSRRIPALLSSIGLHFDSCLIWTYNHTELGLACQGQLKHPTKTVVIDSHIS